MTPDDGQHVSIDNGVTVGGGAFSVCAWAKWGSFGDYSRVFDFGNGEDSDNIYLANAKTTNTLLWSIRRGGQSRFIEVAKILQLDTWIHVCGTVSSAASETCVSAPDYRHPDGENCAEMASYCSGYGNDRGSQEDGRSANQACCECGGKDDTVEGTTGHMYLFLDGVEQECTGGSACDTSTGKGSNGWTPSRLHRQNAYIGRSNWDDNQYFAGSISDLTVIDGHAVSTDEEATAIMNYKPITRTAAPAAEWYCASKKDRSFPGDKSTCWADRINDKFEIPGALDGCGKLTGSIDGCWNGVGICPGDDGHLIATGGWTDRMARCRIAASAINNITDMPTIHCRHYDLGNGLLGYHSQKDCELGIKLLAEALKLQPKGKHRH